MKFIRSFREGSENDKNLIGSKATSISSLLKEGFRTSPGYIITNDGFFNFLDSNSLKDKINNHLNKISKDNSNIAETSNKIKKEVLNAKFSDELKEEIIESYQSLGFDFKKNDANSLLTTNQVYVAVRPSFDFKEIEEKFTFPSHLNVLGIDRVLDAIKKIYSDSFSENLLKSIINNNNSIKGIAIIIQKMVNSKKSGISLSFEEENPDTIIVKACFGLGNMLKTSNFYPDIYKINKISLEILGIKVPEKQFEYRLNSVNEETEKHFLKETGKKQVLSHHEIVEIARLTKKISKKFQKEFMIEWAIEDDKIFILQTKEIQTSKPQNSTEELKSSESVVVEVFDEEDEIPEVIDIDEKYDLDEDLKALEEIEQGSEKILEKELVEELILDTNPPLQQNQIDENEDIEEDTKVKFPENKPEESITIENKQEEEELDFDEFKISDEILVDPKEDKSNILVSEEYEEIVIPPQIIIEEDENTNEQETESDLISEDLLEKEDTSIFASLEDLKQSEEAQIHPLDENNKPEISQEPNQIYDKAVFNSGNIIVTCDMAIIAKLKKIYQKKYGATTHSFTELTEKLIEEVGNFSNEINQIHSLKSEFLEGINLPNPNDVEMALRITREFIEKD